MKNIQLIASDIDGTLLLNGSQAIDPEILTSYISFNKKVFSLWQLLVENIQIYAIYSLL